MMSKIQNMALKRDIYMLIYHFVVIIARNKEDNLKDYTLKLPHGQN